MPSLHYILFFMIGKEIRKQVRLWTTGERVCSAVRNSSVKDIPISKQQENACCLAHRVFLLLSVPICFIIRRPNPILNLFRSQPYTATQNLSYIAPELHSNPMFRYRPPVQSTVCRYLLPGAQIHTSHSVPGPPDTASNPEGWQTGS